MHEPKPRPRATILSADDNGDNLRLVSAILEGEGYRVLVAKDGEAALRIARAELPDLVLLDVHMPRMDGYEACRRIGEDPALRDMPVLVLSGMNEVFNKVEAFKAGAVDYIVKPFHAAELLARVGTHLELSRSRTKVRDYATRLEEALRELKETEARALASEKRTALATLGSGMAHELNNPVNYMVAGAEALERNLADIFAALRETLGPEPAARVEARAGESLAEIPRLIEGIKLGAERASRIVKSLEAFSTVGSGLMAEAELVDALENALALAEERHRSRPCRVERAYESRPRLRCDPEKLTELLFSLVDNALDAAAASADPLVSLSVAVQAGEGRPFAAVTVGDSGPGIPEQARSRIFDPFFTTKEIGQGTGLGLSIAQGIAIEHGGVLELRDGRPGRTSFRLLLPLGGAH